MKNTKEVKNPKLSRALKKSHKNRVIEKISSEDDYIYSKKFNNSLNDILQKYPDGVPNNLIAKVLKIKASQIDSMLNRIFTKLKEQMK